jgi:hypothetical protein
MKKMQTFSGTPISLIHTPFDRACDGDQEYHPLIISSPSFPDKNYEILREVRKHEKMGASRKSRISSPRNIKEPRGFDIQTQNKNLHQTMRLSTNSDHRMGPQRSRKSEFVRLQKYTLRGFHSSQTTSYTHSLYMVRCADSRATKQQRAFPEIPFLS